MRGLRIHVLLPQVSEEIVLTDQTGFHLGAGPYMLIYSRAVPEGDEGPLPWPEHVVVRAIRLLLPPRRVHTSTRFQREVDRHNEIFLESVEPEAETQQTIEVSIPSSTSASGFNTPLEDPITPGERMDVST